MSRRTDLAAIDRMEPAVRRGFSEFVAGVNARLSVGEVERLIVAGNAEAIAAALAITTAELDPVLEALRTAYVNGGKAANVPRMTFDVRNPTAERDLRNTSSRLVTLINREQREGIRIVLAEDASIGRNPRQTALDIVGRIGATGRRTGGIVGLSAPQARWVTSARAELSDPERMANYFTRTRRDRRFDGVVRRAMEAGRPVGARDIERIAGRYSDRLLQLRGETIARTETIAAFNGGKDQAFIQAIEEGRVQAGSVVKVWQATMDGKTRDIHAEMDGQDVPQGQPFQSPTGSQLMYPGDTSLGAGGVDVINCRCTLSHRVDYAVEALRRAA